MNADDLLRLDKAHLWHPYSATCAPVFPVVSASGVRLRLADGRELIDGMSSWWAAIHGYNHPRLNAALEAQTARMAHVMFGGLTHPPAVELARDLAAILPAGLERIFFCDSGSVAVEVAIKMALQYWRARGRPERTRLATIRRGYHGDTFAAMSVCDPERGMHRMFADVLPKQIFVREPRCGDECDEQACDEMARALAQHGDETAAVILEPVVQGAGGMRIYAAEYVARVRRMCDEHDVLLILDEIATGFGRTGAMFACEAAGVAPDVMCLGKSLSAGYLSLAAVAVREEVARGVDESEAGALMHGPTYMANPLACAVANENLKLLADGEWRGRVAAIEDQLRRELAPCAEYDGVADVRVKGAIGVVQMREEVDTHALSARFVDAGVWVRPFADVVYLMPPFIIGEDDLARLGRAVREVLKP